MSDDSGSDSGSGGLARRHRRELRALEAEWLKKIKAVPKANKKGKKALQAAMADAVDEARARHVRELEGDGGGSDDGGGSEDGGGSCGSADADGDAPVAESAAGAVGGTGDKLSKKQRRQMAREARTEAILAEARADSLNAPDHAAIERAAIVARLTPHGLVQEEIKGDGHCLFRAVGAQLARRTEGDPELADVVEMLDACRLAGDRAAITGAKSDDVVKSLRRTVAGEIRARWDDEYAPFMLGEDGTMPDRDVYCDKVRDTSEWGGNAEIVALARTLHCPIIVTSKANERTFGEDEPGVPIHLTYLKHAFGGIGEHYNSTIRVADLVRPEP